VTDIETAKISTVWQGVVWVVYSGVLGRKSCDLAYDNWKNLVFMKYTTQLVEPLCYKPESCGLDSWWGEGIFHRFNICLAALWP